LAGNGAIGMAGDPSDRITPTAPANPDGMHAAHGITNW
jgi:hypothetical protein